MCSTLQIPPFWPFQINPLDPSKLPTKVDLGGVTAVLESYPGHSGTDIIVRVPEQNVVYAGRSCVFQHVPGLLRRAGYCVRLAANVEDIRFLGQGHSFCSRVMARFVARRHCAPAGALRRYRRAGAKDAQAGVPALEAADLYEIPENTRMSLFCLGLLHRTYDYEAVCGVGSQVIAAAVLGRGGTRAARNANREERRRSCE